METRQIRCHLCRQEKMSEWEGPNDWHSVDCGDCGQYVIGARVWEFRFNVKRPTTILTDKERDALANWVKRTWAKDGKRVRLMDVPRIDQIIGRKPPEPGISMI